MTNELWITYRVLSYLVKHPLAKDTLAGIAQWWILKEHINQSVEKVSAALDLLVSKELVITKENLGQEKHYKINKEKLGEIKRVLTEMEGIKPELTF